MTKARDAGGRDDVMAVLETARAFWHARILMTAAELDVFSILSDGAKTAKHVAEKLASNSRGTETLLNALAGQGLLVKEGQAFRVTPGLERQLDSSTPETIIPVLLHMAHLWKTWSNLTEIVRTGEGTGSPDALARDEKTLTAFIGAMHALGRRMAPSVVGRLDLRGRHSVIDVGGGSGVYTIAVLRAAPHAHATIFDRPTVIEIARRKLEEEGLLDRVRLVKGDFYTDALPGGHDVALLSAIIHQNSREQNIALYEKVFHALVPGGMVVIRDYVMSGDHTEPSEGAIFAVNMLVNTPGGATYAFEEITRDLEAAGFTGGRLVHQSEMDSLVTAIKPA